MKKVTTLLWTAIAMATMAIGPQSAHAQDEKTYIPAFCRAVSGAITFGTSHGEIYNASTDNTLVVQRPIVRDSTKERIESITVTLRDRNAAVPGDVICGLRARRETGSIVGSNRVKSAGATPVGTFEIHTLDPAGPFPGDDASVLLECLLPRATSASIYRRPKRHLPLPGPRVIRRSA